MSELTKHKSMLSHLRYYSFTEKNLESVVGESSILGYHFHLKVHMSFLRIDDLRIRTAEY